MAARGKPAGKATPQAARKVTRSHRTRVSAIESPAATANSGDQDLMSAWNDAHGSAAAEPIELGLPPPSSAEISGSTESEAAQLSAAVAQIIGEDGAWAFDDSDATLAGPVDLAAVESFTESIEKAESLEDGQAVPSPWPQAAREASAQHRLQRDRPAQSRGRATRRGDAQTPYSPAAADVRALDALSTRRDRAHASLPSAAASTSAPAAPPQPRPLVDVSDSVALAQPAAAAVELLPPLEQPDPVPAHRTAGVPAEHLGAATATPKFRERYTALLEQLRAWDYFAPDKSQRAAGRRVLPKAALTRFARGNPDLLHTLAVRDLHIFSKKMAAFPRRALDRKVRAAGERLCNRYGDCQAAPTFNGNPTFQDVTRLLLFVSLSDFPQIEATAPGIVAAAAELIPGILTAAAQPPAGEAARLAHSREWLDQREHMEEALAALGERRVDRRRARAAPYAPPLPAQCMTDCSVF